MTIDVKGSRSTADAEPAAQKFDFFGKQPRLTKLPVHIGTVVIALALYVWSLFETPDPKTPDEKPRDKPAPEDGPDDIRMHDRSASREHPEKGEPDTKGDIPDFGTSTLAQTDWSPSILLADRFAPLQFTRFAFEVPGIKAFPAAFGFSTSNDNRPRPTLTDAEALRPVVNAPFVPAQPGSPPKGTDGNAPDTDVDDGDADADADGGDGETPQQPTPTNRAPRLEGSVRLNDLVAGQIMMIGLTHLLWGASDPDGDPLSIGRLDADILTAERVGSGWRIATEPGMLGPVTLTYTITDGDAVVWQTAHFAIVRNTRTLTPGDDLFVGSPYDDDIDGLAGNDIIDAMGGNDLVVGGLGDDHLMGGTGNDTLYGGAGDDVIFGGEGNDIIYGEQGNDRLFGDAGDDTLDGGDGDDILDGGAGNDILRGGNGRDTLNGGAGQDILVGDAGDDTLKGGAGHDVLDGGEGADHLAGGDGNDVVLGGLGNDHITGGEGDDTLDGGLGNDVVDAGPGNDTVIGGAGDDIYEGGEGFDVLDYSGTASDLIVDTGNGDISSDTTGEDQFGGFEHIKGGAGDDLFVVTGSAQIISGGRGRDTFVFQVNDDRPTLSEDLVHDILDFVVGDRVRVREYDISREDRAAERDLFRAIYDDDDDDWLRTDFPLLITHDHVEGINMTIIRADINNDAVFDLTLNIHGVHLGHATDTLSA